MALAVSKLSEEVKTPFSLPFFQLFYFVYYFRPYVFSTFLQKAPMYHKNELITFSHLFLSSF